MVDFEKFKIKTYDQWDLYLHEKQFPFIGRAYAWARRKDANFLSDMSLNERNELFDIVIPGWEIVTKELFNHDRSNLAILGNTFPHLHAHLIPRYNVPRVFKDIEFIDPNPLGNYSPYPKKDLDENLLSEIRNLYQYHPKL